MRLSPQGLDFDSCDMQLSEYNEVASRSNTGSIRDDTYWTSRENSLELIVLSGSIRDDTYWTSRENSLELIELSSINKVSLVV
jgi:hypothetical protein